MDIIDRWGGHVSDTAGLRIVTTHWHKPGRAGHRGDSPVYSDSAPEEPARLKRPGA